MIELENIIYDELTVDYALENLKSMMEKHFEEAEHAFADKALNLNTDIIKMLDANGSIFIFAAKDKELDKIVGYCILCIEESIITKVKAASEMGLYVAPEYRSLGIASELLLRSEVLLKNKGVEAIKIILKDKNKGLHSTIYNLGYELEDLGYYKRI